VLASQTPAEPLGTGLGDELGNAMGSTIGDLSPTQAEQSISITETTQTAVNTTTNQPPPPSVVPPATVSGVIRIVFRLP
jgi:hypothetical protein